MPGLISSSKFGVEQEHFLFADGQPPTIEQLQGLFARFLRFGFKSVDGPAQVLGVFKDTPWGTLAIKNDACTHILEIAFPPLETAGSFTDLYHAVRCTIEESILEMGLSLHFDGALEQVPPGTIFVPSPGDPLMERFGRSLARAVPSSPFSHVAYFTAMCATQVHLDVANSVLFHHLAGMYSLEYLVPLFFANGTKFQGISAHCVRPLMYRDSYYMEYHLAGWPRLIASSADEYSSLVSRSVGFYRDYSFITQTRFGTVEFRSACSQPDSGRILELVALRFAVTKGVASGLVRSRADDEDMFWKACLDGTVPQVRLRADLNMLDSLTTQLPGSLRDSYIRLLARMHTLVL